MNTLYALRSKLTGNILGFNSYYRLLNKRNGIKLLDTLYNKEHDYDGYSCLTLQDDRYLDWLYVTNHPLTLYKFITTNREQVVGAPDIKNISMPNLPEHLLGNVEIVKLVDIEWQVFDRNELKSPFLIKYENGEFPECYIPCPPFYYICNHGAYVINQDEHPEKHKCLECYKKFDFEDYIE